MDLFGLNQVLALSQETNYSKCELINYDLIQCISFIHKSDPFTIIYDTHESK